MLDSRVDLQSDLLFPSAAVRTCTATGKGGKVSLQLYYCTLLGQVFFHIQNPIAKFAPAMVNSHFAGAAYKSLQMEMFGATDTLPQFGNAWDRAKALYCRVRHVQATFYAHQTPRCHTFPQVDCLPTHHQLPYNRSPLRSSLFLARRRSIARVQTPRAQGSAYWVVG